MYSTRFSATKLTTFHQFRSSPVSPTTTIPSEGSTPQPRKTKSHSKKSSRRIKARSTLKRYNYRTAKSGSNGREAVYQSLNPFAFSILENLKNPNIHTNPRVVHRLITDQTTPQGRNLRNCKSGSIRSQCCELD